MMVNNSAYPNLYAKGKGATNQVLTWLREEAGLEDPRDTGNSPVRAWVPWTRIAINKPDAVVPETILSSLETAIECREDIMQYHDPDTCEDSQHAFALAQLRVVRYLLSTLPRRTSPPLIPASQAAIAIRNRWETLPVDVPDLGWSSGGSNTSRDSSMEPCAHGGMHRGVAVHGGKRKRQNKPRSGHHEPAHQRQKSSLSHVLDYAQQLEDGDKIDTRTFTASPTHKYVWPAAKCVEDFSVRVDHTDMVTRHHERKHTAVVESVDIIPAHLSTNAANKMIPSAPARLVGRLALRRPEFIPGARFHAPAALSSFTTTNNATTSIANTIFSGHNTDTAAAAATRYTTTSNTTTTEFTTSPGQPFNDFEVEVYGGPPWDMYDGKQPLDLQSYYSPELAETFYNQWMYAPD